MIIFLPITQEFNCLDFSAYYTFFFPKFYLEVGTGVCILITFLFIYFFLWSEYELHNDNLLIRLLLYS